MALTTLSLDHKELLLQNSNFIKHVKWATLDKAAYWIGLDGTSLPGGVTPTSLDRWRKSKSFAKAIQASPVLAENLDIVKKFLNTYIKAIACIDDTVTIDLFDDAAQKTVIDYLQTNNHFDAMADKWFDDQISTNL